MDKVKCEHFLEVWQRDIGPIEQRDGLKSFLNFVSRPDVSPIKLEQAVANLARDWSAGKLKRKPRYNDFVSAYYSAAGRPKGSNMGPVSNCTLCGRSGMVPLVFGGNNAGVAKPLRRQPRYFAYLALSMVPCLCETGSYKNKALEPPYPRERLDELHRQCVFATPQKAQSFIDDCRELGDPQPKAPAGNVGNPAFAALTAKPTVDEPAPGQFGIDVPF